MADLMAEVGRFRTWADAYPHAGRYGEWECYYEAWPSLCQAVLGFVAGRPFESWSEAEVRAVLYAIARDNEIQHLAGEIRERHPELVPPLAWAALRVGERDDRWQLAVELGRLGPESEPLLLEMARDEHEYVRRLALHSLLQIGSPAVEELALAAWHRRGVGPSVVCGLRHSAQYPPTEAVGRVMAIRSLSAAKDVAVFGRW